MTSIAKPVQLTALKQCEEIIERGLDSFIEVGNALLRIREGRLYNPDYDNFETYCRERWDMSGSRAHQLVDSAKVMQQLGTDSTIVELPRTESQARPLAKLEPAEQRKAWQKAVDSSPTGKPTAKEVEAAVEVIAPKNDRITYTPSNGLQYAQMAIDSLEKIQANDTQREKAFQKVKNWIAQQPNQS